MYNILLAIIMFASIVSCGKNESTLKHETNDIKRKKDTNTTSTGLKPNQVILPIPSSVLWACGKNSKPFEPAEDDILAAEEILRVCYNKEVSGTHNPFFGRKLENYHRQFAGAVLDSGDKVIWINCFCYVDNDYLRKWKENFIMVDDGGNCFFNVKVNLNTGQYYDLMVNGNA